jgi:hypothetical protein
MKLFDTGRYGRAWLFNTYGPLRLADEGDEVRTCWKCFKPTYRRGRLCGDCKVAEDD